MHAVTVTVKLDPKRQDEMGPHLDNTVAMSKQMPGFVGGTWLRALDSESGQGILIFKDEASANAFANQDVGAPAADAPVTFVSAEVFEVVAQA